MSITASFAVPGLSSVEGSESCNAHTEAILYGPLRDDPCGRYIRGSRRTAFRFHYVPFATRAFGCTLLGPIATVVGEFSIDPFESSAVIRTCA